MRGETTRLLIRQGGAGTKDSQGRWAPSVGEPTEVFGSINGPSADESAQGIDYNTVAFIDGRNPVTIGADTTIEAPDAPPHLAGIYEVIGKAGGRRVLRITLRRLERTDTSHAVA
jgi:hypothetical protein